jgi:hypothetical protein
MRHVLLALVLAGLLVRGGPPDAAAQTIRSAVGATPGDIQGTVDAFRADLGPLNPNDPGSVVTGRREIDYDGVGDAGAAPGRLPADFFNSFSPSGVVSPRGVVFATTGSGLQVSADAVNPTGTPADFADLVASYATAFQPFSPPRLFAPLDSTVLDVLFFVPGSSTPALTRGLGVVFTDVDVPGSTDIEYFDEVGDRLLVQEVPASGGDASLSFVGVSFPTARIARARITLGSAPLGLADVTQGGPGDVVVTDDVIFGEPVPVRDLLALSPPSGRYLATQRFDLALVVKAGGRTVQDGQALLDGNDVTAPLLGCLVPGTALPDLLTFRCPALAGPGGVGTRQGLAPGTHTLTVTLTFDDGEVAKAKAVWEILPNTE